MGKLTKYAIKLIIASVFVWFITILIFTDEIVFIQSAETTEDIAAGDAADGSYTGTGEGAFGPIEVEVTVEGGEITQVIILDHNETNGISDPAIEEIPAAITENNSTAIDIVSGATASSEGIIAAVNNALSDLDGTVATEADYTDGTYSATAEGHNGPIEVEVIVENGTISRVEILSHEETNGISDPAIEEIPTAVVENNTPEVEAVSGATVSSEAIIEAVNTALEEAH